ncbi:phage major capsid protein [Mycobacterium sp. PDNC021]|uniref:phage major capsid protein n=1 Tax=Mycobacterium sp. PDNC021 TaxID=3391399 RepID=UPI003AACEF4C
MSIAIPGGNTTLLTQEIAKILVQPLQQASTFLAAGPIIMDSASELRVPRIASGATANFVAAGAQIADGTVGFDEVTLLPSTLEGLKVLVKMSNELIRQSVVALEATLQARLVTDVANALDAALWNGTGTGNTIKGILKHTGIATGDLDLADADSLIDGVVKAQTNHVAPTHWAMNATTFGAFRKLKVGTTDNRYIFDPSAAYAANQYSLLGLPVIITSQIPNNTAALIDFSKVAVARDVDSEVKLLDQTWGDYDSVGIRVVSRFDVALLQDKAVTLLTVPAGP